MSKSKGNVVNPLDMIEKYGTDALRLSLIMSTTPGLDSRIYEEKIQAYRNFVNKLWNISRYILSHKPESKTREKMPLSLADEWILEQLGKTVASVNDKLNNFEFGQAGEELMKFTKDQFADWYLEISKINPSTNSRQKSNSTEILPEVLATLLKLWHPFAPFVTEHLWSQLSAEMLMIQEYPTAKSKVKKSALSKVEGSKVQTQFTALQELITGLRNLRSEYRLPPSETLACYLELPKTVSWIKEQQATIEKLARVRLNFEAMDEAKKMPYFIWQGKKTYLVIPHFDPKKEIALTEKDLGNAEKLAMRYESQLGKKDFLKKAPDTVVEKLKRDFAGVQDLVEKLRAKIHQLK